MNVTKEIYQKWLTSAYRYYWSNENPLMSDAEWDHIGKQINPEDWDELRGTNYEPGQSLYWLSKNKYPEWATK